MPHRACIIIVGGGAIGGARLIENGAGVEGAFLTGGRFEVDLAGVRHAATAHLRGPYDPKSERVNVVEVRAAA